jgi:hypothetical protein
LSIPLVFPDDVKLEWDAVDAPTLSGYKLYYGSASGSYQTTIDVGNVTTFTVTGLNPGTYYFAVSAYDTTGNESGFSNEISTTIVDTTAPVISGVQASVITAVSASVLWTTDEPSDSQIEYGTTTAYRSTTSVNPTLVTSHSQTIAGLSPGTLYHFHVKSRDASGNLAVSPDFAFTTLASPPVISNMTASAITTSSAVISWTTDKLSDSQVEYGTTIAYGSSTPLNNPVAFQKVTAHALPLTGLSGGTLYHFRVKSRDTSGNLGISGDFTFTTLSSAPVISSMTAFAITISSALISWTTDKPANSQVEYGITAAYGSSTTLDTTLVTAHAQTIAGLSAGTLYHFHVKSRDASGNLAVSPDFTFTTLASPPVISNVTASAVTISSALISWTTDKPANSQVEYGITAVYGSSTTLDTTLVTAHAQTIAGLSAGTLYHFHVKSTDASGNLTVSPDFTFTTFSEPFISAVNASAITTSDATITWTTDEPSDSQVWYGTTTANGMRAPLIVSIIARVTAHSVLLTGLTSNTLYHFKVRSMDTAGRIAFSDDFTFITPPSDITIAAIATNAGSGIISSTGGISRTTEASPTDESSWANRLPAMTPPPSDPPQKTYKPDPPDGVTGRTSSQSSALTP